MTIPNYRSDFTAAQAPLRQSRRRRHPDSPRPDREAERINRELPAGYRALRRWGRWDLLKDIPRPDGGVQSVQIIRTGIKNRWEVFRLVRRHSKGRPMPYVYSVGYWLDIERGKSALWMRFVDFLRFPYVPLLAVGALTSLAGCTGHDGADMVAAAAVEFVMWGPLP